MQIRKQTQKKYKNNYKRNTNTNKQQENLSETSPLLLLQLIPPKMMTDLYTTCGAPVKRLAR